jgi:transcriptional regulator GlxA family with amidase domain
VGIVIFDDVEVLDFCGPFEVFSITVLEGADAEEIPAFEVVLVAEELKTISTVGGMKVIPDVSLADCPPLDIVIIPGGWGTRAQMKNLELRNWVQSRATEVQILASVCTGSFVLGAAGLLEGRRATTHWELLEDLRRLCLSATVVADEHVVEDENLFTSAGISAGIDMALRIVERCVGEAAARATAKDMEYPYPEDNSRRVEIGDPAD